MGRTPWAQSLAISFVSAPMLTHAFGRLNVRQAPTTTTTTTTTTTASVAASSSEPDYSYQYCGLDSTHESNSQAVAAKKTSTSNNTVEYCSEFCLGYEYFGLKASTDCYCLMSLSGWETDDAGKCDLPCPSNSNEKCGGQDNFGLYMHIGRSAVGSSSTSYMSAASSYSVTTPTLSATGTEKPLQTCPIEQCPYRNVNSALFYIRSHVIFGDKEFENLYMQKIPYTSGSTPPTMLCDKPHAFLAYFDVSSRSIALKQDDGKLSGLEMVQDEDRDAYGPVLIDQAVGTARLDVREGQIIWDNDRFGDWLICKDAIGKYTLSYWDVITNQGTDPVRCAKVQLLTEYDP